MYGRLGLRTSRRWARLSLRALVLCVAGAAGCGVDPTEPTVDRIASAIGRGLDALAREQLPSGQFKTYFSFSRDLARTYEDVSPFATGKILTSLKSVNEERTAPMRSMGASFLESRKEPRSLWRYWPTVPPDLDDTAVISIALNEAGISTAENPEVFFDARDPGGLFYTWIGLAGDDISQRVDCVVNANVLAYLGEGTETLPACSWINQIVSDNKEADCASFYIGTLPAYFAISSASHRGVSCLSAVDSVVLARVLSLRQADGSYGNALETALAANTLLNYEYRGPELAGAIRHLLGTQAADGSWPIALYWVGDSKQQAAFGSGALTTAAAIEALARYVN